MLLRKLLDNHASGDESGDALSHEVEPFPHIDDLQKFLQKAKKRFEQDWNFKSIPHDNISDYHMYQILARGKFNTVILAKHKDSSNKSALKCFDKSRLVHSNRVDRVHYEMKVMLAVSFPFVISLNCVMQDKTSLYLSMPFIECGDLYMHIRKLGGLEELHAKFYAAQVCLGLEYLHCVNIVHRDLKPENILVNFFGNLKIADMGYCKIVDSRTYSFCGTPEYIAPEIIKTQPYAASVDWWSFGVLLYEMCCGRAPFKNKNTYKLYATIVSGQYSTPNFMSKELQDLIRNLLEVDVTKRYGCLCNGVKDIKEHPWFQAVDWAKLVNRKAPIPYAPYCLGPALQRKVMLSPPRQKNTSALEQYDYLFDNF